MEHPSIVWAGRTQPPSFGVAHKLKGRKGIVDLHQTFVKRDDLCHGSTVVTTVDGSEIPNNHHLDV